MQLYKVIAQLKTVNLRDPAETVKFSQQPGSPHKRLNLSHWAYPVNVNKSQLSMYLLTFNLYAVFIKRLTYNIQYSKHCYKTNLKIITIIICEKEISKTW